MAFVPILGTTGFGAELSLRPFGGAARITAQQVSRLQKGRQHHKNITRVTVNKKPNYLDIGLRYLGLHVLSVILVTQEATI